MGEPQFSKSFILRPYAGFEAIYNNTSSSNPIMFTEGGKALDVNAGKPGYDPELVRGVPVPMGARAILWLPRIMAGTAESFIPYDWRFQFRLRSTFDFRQDRAPYHYPKQSEGVPDGVSPRVVIPAAYQTLVYNQAESTGNVTTVSQHILQERMQVFRGPVINQNPKNPSGNAGVIQQGLMPISDAMAESALYMIFEFMCAGDELILGASRGTVNGDSNWDFDLPAGQDTLFGQEFGSLATGGPFPDVGVYLHVGTAG
jgi:hypothetical protein